MTSKDASRHCDVTVVGTLLSIVTLTLTISVTEMVTYFHCIPFITISLSVFVLLAKLKHLILGPHFPVVPVIVFDRCLTNILLLLHLGFGVRLQKRSFQ